LGITATSDAGRYWRISLLRSAAETPPEKIVRILTKGPFLKRVLFVLWTKHFGNDSISKKEKTMFNLPITGIGAFIDFLVLAFFYFRLSKVDLNQNKLLYLFTRFTLFFSLFYLLFAVPALVFPESGLLIGVGYLIGHAFSYVAFGYLARIWVMVGNVNLNEKKLFTGYLVFGAFLTLLNIIFFTSTRYFEPGVIDWNMHSLVGPLIILFGLTAFAPAGFFFIREGIKSAEKRRRSLLIGASFILIIVGGPLHDVAKTAGMRLFADFVTTTGFILMFVGLLSKVKMKEKQKTAKEAVNV